MSKYMHLKTWSSSHSSKNHTVENSIVSWRRRYDNLRTLHYFQTTLALKPWLDTVEQQNISLLRQGRISGTPGHSGIPGLYRIFIPQSAQVAQRTSPARKLGMQAQTSKRDEAGKRLNLPVKQSVRPGGCTKNERAAALCSLPHGLASGSSLHLFNEDIKARKGRTRVTPCMSEYRFLTGFRITKKFWDSK